MHLPADAVIPAIHDWVRPAQAPAPGRKENQIMLSLELHPDRLLPAQPEVRTIARRLYAQAAGLPIISPHGHTDAAWFADNAPFADAAQLLIKPDHYVYRMLYSLGVPLWKLGLSGDPAHPAETDNRQVWRCFAEHYHVFRGTPTRLWLDHVFAQVFGFKERLSMASADRYFDQIGELLASDAFRPRALFDRFNIEVLATTESPLDDLRHHRALRDSEWEGRVITTFRPDPVVDPHTPEFADNVARLGKITAVDTSHWPGYLEALRRRRDYFRELGATATDHGHPSAVTADLSQSTCETLFRGAMAGSLDAAGAELFRGQMLTEMAAMSLDDGLVMQLHPGSYRNHNPWLFEHFGRDKGADIPLATEYVRALKPLLDRFGNAPGFSLILFTLDEASYSRELAPLAGHYPCLKLGPSWWFHDSPEGMRRFRAQVTETAGFYNTVGFNDDTRAFLSIPARHDVARRMDAGFLAELVADHRLAEDEAAQLMIDLSCNLARQAYRF
jgi:glucuronate isomerase